MSKLLACPFCASNAISYDEQMNDMVCATCGATSPPVRRKGGKALAVAAWNTRPAVAPVSSQAILDTSTIKDSLIVADPRYDARCALQDRTDWIAA